HAAHRGAMRGGLAPAGQPSGTEDASDEVGGDLRPLTPQPPLPLRGEGVQDKEKLTPFPRSFSPSPHCGRGGWGVRGRCFMSEHYFIVGGAGFIGSHFIDRLLAADHVRRVTVYDNFTSGQPWHYEEHLRDRRLKIVAGDIHDFAALKEAMAGHE